MIHEYIENLKYIFRLIPSVYSPTLILGIACVIWAVGMFYSIYYFADKINGGFYSVGLFIFIFTIFYAPLIMTILDKIK